MVVKSKGKMLTAAAFLVLLISGCSTTKSAEPTPAHDPPPILAEDEVIRPYVRLGRIQITREVYGILDYHVTPEIREWGLNAVRAEADRMGADAVITPEITGVRTTFVVVPSTEYRATGIAIKFK